MDVSMAPQLPIRSSKRKKPRNPALTTTIRSLPYTYLHLSLITALPSAPPTIDPITARTHLTSALQQFLGLTGTAISVDILNVERRDVWIRVPEKDETVVVEALSGWVSSDVRWRISGRGKWLGGVMAGDGRDLFVD